MKILLWHLHGGWTDAFTRGRHRYLLPTNPARDSWGLGTGGRDWPTAEEIVLNGSTNPDLVLLQRPEELTYLEQATGLHAGTDIPAIYLEHNTPTGDVPRIRHPLADQHTIPIVHVTHYNALIWDTGQAPTYVIEHGIVDPGYHYRGHEPRAASVLNDPVRRGRATGTDLLAHFSRDCPVDLFGLHGADVAQALGADPQRLTWVGEYPPEQLHTQLAQRRFYLHTSRWTSLSLALLEAMHLGMPVIAVGSTEAWRAIPAGAGAVSTSTAELRACIRFLLTEPGVAAEWGAAARQAARERYNLARFLRDWDEAFGLTHTGIAA